MTKEIRHTVTLGATPARVYAALMDRKKHAQFTGGPARISRRVGGAFRCYGDYITGTTLYLEPGKRIVQAWRTRNWPPGTYSIVQFALSAKAGGRTRLAFTQTGVPAWDYEDKNRGWRTHYWQPLKRFLET